VGVWGWLVGGGGGGGGEKSLNFDLATDLALLLRHFCGWYFVIRWFAAFLRR